MRATPLLAAFASLVAPFFADAATAPGAGLKGTAHDFTGSGNVGLCSYCHTPHKAGTTLVLWNHELSSNNFHWDVPATTVGTPLPTIGGTTYKGTSAKCLSCHDGSVAVGAMGWYEGRSWLDAGAFGGTKKVTDPNTVGARGSLAGTHPVGVPYPHNKTPNTYNGVRTGNLFIPAEWQADPVSLPGSRIRLFKDDGSGNMSLVAKGAATSSAGIECSSCHDPHNKDSLDALFLRGKLAGSTQGEGYLCLQCHVM